jgi:hypothetical protein
MYYLMNVNAKSENHLVSDEEKERIRVEVARLIAEHNAKHRHM